MKVLFEFGCYVCLWLTAQRGKDDDREGEKETEEGGVSRKNREDQVRKWSGCQDHRDNDNAASLHVHIVFKIFPEQFIVLYIRFLKFIDVFLIVEVDDVGCDVVKQNKRTDNDCNLNIIHLFFL